jgi:hypothetical protein
MRSGMHEDGSKHRLISQSSQHIDKNGNRVDALHWPVLCTNVSLDISPQRTPYQQVEPSITDARMQGLQRRQPSAHHLHIQVSHAFGNAKQRSTTRYLARRRNKASDEEKGTQ